MQRRKFITLLGGAAAAWPLAARAQQPAMPVIGFLNAGSAILFADRLRAFHQGLNEIGFAEGRNLAIDYRWADDQYDRLPALAAELVRRQVAMIVATTAPAALAAKAATTAIPIVFEAAVDPVMIGLVTSLNQPGGNLTGVTSLNVEVAPKRVELLHEVIPTVTTIAALINPANPNAESQSSDLQVAARTLGLKLQVLYARTEGDFFMVFKSLGQRGPDGLVIGADAFFTSHAEHLAVLALGHAVPAIFEYRKFAAAGGLMSYGGSFTDAYRQAGIYAGRVLKGEKPADLPVQQSTKVELIVNLKTAKALGLVVPPQIVARADEVIE
jgi:putative ABC transport system substrate-binding protein